MEVYNVLKINTLLEFDLLVNVTNQTFKMGILLSADGSIINDSLASLPLLPPAMERLAAQDSSSGGSSHAWTG